MKTIRNIQKTAARATVIAITVAAISFSVEAQDFWRQLTSHSGQEMAEMVTVNRALPAPADNRAPLTEAAFTETAREEPLELESWMTNESYFTTKTRFEEATDSPLQLEAWMTNSANFVVAGMSETAREEPLELESWMTSEIYFSTGIEKEKPLQLESWMTDPEIWK